MSRLTRSSAATVAPGRRHRTRWIRPAPGSGSSAAAARSGSGSPPCGSACWCSSRSPRSSCKSFSHGADDFWSAVTAPDALAALRLTVETSLLVSLVDVVMGTLVAWVLVRDEFVGKRILEVVIDLPFALPTIVAGLVLLALYGPQSPLHLNLADTRTGVFLALLFVTLPFVVRTVQPVLIELDRDMEEAAASLGASRFVVFRRIVLPNLAPAIAAGTALSFARAISEYGATGAPLGQHPAQDAGGVGADRRPDRERQHRGRGRRGHRAAGHRPARDDRPRPCSNAGPAAVAETRTAHPHRARPPWRGTPGDAPHRHRSTCRSCS